MFRIQQENTNMYYFIYIVLINYMITQDGLCIN